MTAFFEGVDMQAEKMSTRDAVIEMIRRMPDDATLSDILYALYVRQEIEEGIKELDAGQGIPHDEVIARVQRWLK